MVRSIGPREAQELVAKGGVDVVDVRELHEWKTGHVPHARLVPLGQLLASFDAAKIGPKVVFICARGGRSTTAAELADKRGIPEVYSVEGGTVGWKAEGLPIVEPVEDEATGIPEEPAEPDPELDAIVATNVRELRTARGLTLDLLAGMSGVGRQTLGQIELGRTTASLGTLWKIARAFEVPFSVLIARPVSAETRVLRAASAKRMVSGDGRFSSRALIPPEAEAKFEFYELWLAGHGRDDADAHAPGTREHLVVTSGRLVLEIAKERYELAKGDSIVFLADKPHAYVNPASEECWMNLVMTYA